MRARTILSTLAFGLLVSLQNGKAEDTSSVQLALVQNPESVEAAPEIVVEAPEATSKRPSASKITNPILKGHLLDNVEVFGKSDMPAIYIFAPGEADIQSMLVTRDFVRDEYFMQNIDREEFEMGFISRQFYDTDKVEKESKE